MTTSKQALVDAAQALRRKVYASLPWGYRLAAFLFELRYASNPESFGRLVYGTFLRAGVTGMGNVPFIPNSSKDIDRLPKGFGLEFGTAARNLARKFITNENDVEDLLSVVGLKVLSDTKLHRAIAGRPLSEARSYVLRVIANQARDVLRFNKIRKHEVLNDILADPSALVDLIADRERFQQELTKGLSPSMAREMVLYTSLIFQGYTNKEIAERKLLPSLQERGISHQMLARRFRERLKTVAENVLSI